MPDTLIEFAMLGHSGDEDKIEKTENTDAAKGGPQ